MSKRVAMRFVVFLFFYAVFFCSPAFSLEAPQPLVKIEGWQKEVPVFSWVKVPDAVFYEVSVDSSSAWKNAGASTVFKPDISQTGIHTLFVRAMGKNAKPGKTLKFTFGVDLKPPEPPEIEKTYPPANAPSEKNEFFIYWKKSLEDKGSGVDYYAGQIDAREPVKITENPWKASLGDGQHVIKIFAYDKAGNASAPAQVTLVCDVLPPTPPQILSNSAASWSNNPSPQMEVQSEDAGSGVAYYEYVADNALDGLVSNIMWVKAPEGENAFTVEPALSTGEYEIWVRAVDKFGHSGEPSLARTFIDTNPPVFEGAISAEPAEPDSALKIKVKWEPSLASDKESGIGLFEGKWDDAETVTNISTDPGWDITLTERVKTPLFVWAVDKAGNKSKPLELQYDVKKKEKELKLKIKSDKEKNASFLQSLDYSGTRISRTFRSVNSSRPGAEGFPTGSTWEQSMVVSVRGLLGNTNIHLQIEDNPAQEQKVFIEIEGKHLYTRLGNFTTTFGVGEFASFTKEIEGVEVGAKYEPVEAKIVFSKGTSFQRTDTFQGLNIKGPYRVNAFNLLQGSESVYVNKNDGSGEQLYTRGVQGVQGYEIDYFGGYITFYEIMNSNWTMRVSYEYSFLDLFFRSGDILGATTTLKFLPGQKLSLSFLKETSKSAEAALSVTQSSTTESFNGHKDTTENSNAVEIQKEYPLSNWPVVERTETVSIKNTNIVKHSFSEKSLFSGKFDYFIDYNRGTVVFISDKESASVLTPPPPVAKDEIQVTYSYKIAYLSSGIIDDVNSKSSTEEQKPEYFVYNFPPQGTGIPSTGYVRDRFRIWRLNADNTKKELLRPDFFNDAKNGITQPRPHYTIDVANGKLHIFTDTTPAPLPTDDYLVEYRDFPEVQQTGEKPSERKVFGVSHSVSLFQNKLVIETEYATSQADKDSFGVKKVEVLKCGQKISDSPLKFQLDPLGKLDDTFGTLSTLTVAPLVPGFDTVKNPARLLTRVTGTGASGEYFIDYNTAQITFQGFTPAKSDTTACNALPPAPDDKTQVTDVTVEYFYFPAGAPISSVPTPVKGSAFKLKSNLNLGKIQLGMGFRKVEAKYIPVGATKPPPELGQYTGNINYQVHKHISLSGNFDQRRTPKVDTNLELTGEETQSTTGGSNIRLAFPKLPAISLSYSLQTNRDNLPKRAVDTKNISQGIDLSYKIGDLDTAFNYRQTDTSNHVENGTSLKENSFDTKLNFVPSQNFTISAGFQQKNVETIAPALTTKSRTRFITSATMYKPSSLVTLNATVNSTNVEDTAKTRPVTINNATIGLRLSSFEAGKLKLRKKPLTINSVGVTMFLEKNPTEIPPTVTRNTGFMFSYSLIPPVTIDHNWTFNRSSRESTFENKTDSFGTNAAYSPPGKKQFQLKLNFQESKTLSLNFSTAGTTENKTRTTTKGIEISLNPIPRLRTAMNYTLSISKAFSASGATESKTASPWIELGYTIGARLNVTTRFQQSRQNASGKTSTRSDLTFTGNLSLNKNTTFVVEVKNVSFNDSQNTDTNKLNYSATLVTGRIELSF